MSDSRMFSFLTLPIGRRGQGVAVAEPEERQLNPQPDPYNEALVIFSVVCYQLAEIKQRPDYLPEIEIQMLSSAIRGLAKDKIRMDMLPSIISLLVEVIDESNKKTKKLNQEDLNAIIDMLYGLPKEAFNLVDPEKYGILRTLLGERFEEKIQSKPLTTEAVCDDIRQIANDQLSRPNISQRRVALIEQLKNEITSNFIKLMSSDRLQVDQLIGLLSVNGDIFFDPPSKILSDMIKLILEKYGEKELFEVLSNIYNPDEHARNQISSLKVEKRFLKNMKLFLTVLGILTSRDLFLKFIDNINLDLDVAYHYDRIEEINAFVIKCLLMGEPIPEFMVKDSQGEVEYLSSFYPYYLLGDDRESVCQALLFFAKNNQKNKNPLLCMDDPALRGILFSLEQYLDQSETQEAFKKFLLHLNRINNKAGTYQQRNILLLIIKYEAEIKQLIELMGTVAIEGMKSVVANTTLPLEKMLSTIPLLEESWINILKIYCKNHVKSKDFGKFKQCLAIIGAIQALKKEPNDVLGLEELITHNLGKGTDELLVNLINYAFDKMFPELQLKLDGENTKAFLKQVPIERLVDLIVASQVMVNDPYRKVYLEFLKADLTGDRDGVLRLLYDTASSPVRELALHNEKIRDILLNHGIDPQMALAYPRKLDVVVLPPNASLECLDADAGYLALWGCIQKLTDTIEELIEPSIDPKRKSQFQVILKNVTLLKDTVKKQSSSDKAADKRVVARVLSKQSAIVNTVVKNCEAIMRTADVQSPLGGAVDAVLKESKLVQKNTETGIDPGNAQPSYFTIQQWDKADPRTLFLGNYVGCCLAAGSTQFPAITQRRMDDALFMHTVIDNATQEPVALIWLYLAKTAEDKIVLVANFFEVKAKFGTDEPKRKALLNALLQFTNQYLNDNPGIEDFYMRKLTYGWNGGDLDRYPLYHLDLLDKVSGPYVPAESSIPQNAKTEQCYYLASLAQSGSQSTNAVALHHFMPTLLQFDPNGKQVVSISNLIRGIIQEKFDAVAYELYVVGNTVNQDLIKNLIPLIIEKYSAVLVHFYDEPLNQNKQLLEEVRWAYLDLFQIKTESQLHKAILFIPDQNKKEILINRLLDDPNGDRFVRLFKSESSLYDFFRLIPESEHRLELFFKLVDRLGKEHLFAFDSNQSRLDYFCKILPIIGDEKFSNLCEKAGGFSGLILTLNITSESDLHVLIYDYFKHLTKEQRSTFIDEIAQSKSDLFSKIKLISYVDLCVILTYATPEQCKMICENLDTENQLVTHLFDDFHGLHHMLQMLHPEQCSAVFEVLARSEQFLGDIKNFYELNHALTTHVGEPQRRAACAALVSKSDFLQKIIETPSQMKAILSWLTPELCEEFGIKNSKLLREKLKEDPRLDRLDSERLQAAFRGMLTATLAGPAQDFWNLLYGDLQPLFSVRSANSWHKFLFTPIAESLLPRIQNKDIPLDDRLNYIGLLLYLSPTACQKNVLSKIDLGAIIDSDTDFFYVLNQVVVLASIFEKDKESGVLRKSAPVLITALKEQNVSLQFNPSDLVSESKNDINLGWLQEAEQLLEGLDPVQCAAIYPVVEQALLNYLADAYANKKVVLWDRVLQTILLASFTSAQAKGAFEKIGVVQFIQSKDDFVRAVRLLYNRGEDYVQIFLDVIGKNQLTNFKISKAELGALRPLLTDKQYQYLQANINRTGWLPSLRGALTRLSRKKPSARQPSSDDDDPPQFRT
jgi:hypothetical protein